MARYSMLRMGRRKELVWTAFFAICIIYYLYKSASGPPESVWIEQLMNDGIAKQPKPTSRTTFDFSKVEPQYLQKNMKPLPAGRPLRMPRVQYPFRSESSSTAKTREYRRQQVRSLFYKNWQSYRKYAWKKDVLQPLSATFKDQFSGWAATLVDSLDTLWIMGFREEFDEAVKAVSEIDFGSATNNRINTFETNIRYLGGLLAAYDLSKREILLQKATELGNLLYLAFNTENGMPVDFIDFEAAKQGNGLTVEWSVVSASPGTLSMEMTHLSQLTGDPKYYDAVARVMDVFYRGQNATELPGMWPMMVSMARQDVVSGNHFTIAGCADSLYEYLPKMHALMGGREPSYEVMSRVFMDVANRTLFFRPMLPGGEDVLIAGNADVINSEHDVVLDPESEHLACFIGGLYALGGKLFSRPDWVDIGGRLTDGCVYAYRAMPTGMMPERYNMVACPSRLSCPWDEGTWEREREKRPEWKEHLPKGFTTAKDPRYILRPEAIESVFVMWRTTGRREYQDAAWDMFRAVSNGTYTEYANAAVLDVTRAEYPLPQEDYMESFWLAETLKYFYLVFSPPDLISLDEWVLNTEAHPFRRPS